MAVLNSDILGRAWLSGSNMFQQRIPNPAISSYAEVVNSLFAPMNNDLFNEFSGLLNGLIGTYVESKLFENPLAVLKKPATQWGNSERHVAIKYLQAHAGRFDDETLLKCERPEFVEWFYSVSEPRRYEFSWSRQDLARAFAADGYGYDDLLAGTISQMLSSANYDEMMIMLQMFAEADNRIDNGLFRYNLSAAPTDEATAKELLKGIRTVAGQMRFPTMLFNHIDVPVYENGDTLVLFITPDALASIDVDALSAVFQLDKAEIQYRIIMVPEFPIANVCAALCSEDFIYYRDFMTGMEPPFYNPGNRTLKYYYWANGMIGFNPAANCVLFTTDEATTIPTVTMTASGIAFDPDSYECAAGGQVQLKLALSGSVSASDGGNENGRVAVEPDAALYSVSASRAVDDDTVAVALNSRTYVDAYGILHVQKTGLEIGDIITVTAKAVYLNPSGSTSAYTDTAEVEIIAATGHGAKECAVATDPYVTYTDETEIVTASE